MTVASVSSAGLSFKEENRRKESVIRMKGGNMLCVRHCGIGKRDKRRISGGNSAEGCRDRARSCRFRGSFFRSKTPAGVTENIDYCCLQGGECYKI